MYWLATGPIQELCGSGVSKYYLFIAALALFNGVLAHGKEPKLELALEPRKGKAPLLVKITGPDILLQRAKECRRAFGGWSFHVDWGDGSTSNPGKGRCAEELQHQYSVPGKFTVTAIASHPGPTDTPVVDFQGNAQVEVGKPTKEIPIALSLTDHKPKDVFWGTGLPHLGFRVKTSRELVVVSELVKAKDGAVLFKESKAISFSGEATIPWIGYKDGPTVEHYDAQGRLSVFYRLRAMAGGKILKEAKSEPFTLHASITFRSFEVKPSVGTAPLEVRISRNELHSGCYSYVVNWGDGSPEESKGRPESAGKSCKVDAAKIELSHTYQRKGAYMIRWYDNSANLFLPASKGLGYMENRVEVR
jgi:hypothetical protein